MESCPVSDSALEGVVWEVEDEEARNHFIAVPVAPAADVCWESTLKARGILLTSRLFDSGRWDLADMFLGVCEASRLGSGK